jgi:hypothetical protein
MPTGKKWTSDECEALATAWINVSEDKGAEDVKGTDQTGEAFWKRVGDTLKSLAPKDPKECIGRFHNREGNALKTKWNDNISRDVKKFNKALLKVISSNLTGVNEQNKINIAVSIVMGKTDAASYRHRDFDPYEWMFYRAWLVLRGHPSFCAPTLKEAVDISEETELEQEPAAETEINVPEQLVTPTATINTMVRRDSNVSNVSSLKPQALSRQSRGPGKGKTATREKAKDDANTKRKLDILDRIATTMEENTAINKKKARDINMFVRSTTRAQAFMVGYKGQKLEDATEHEKMHYKTIMTNAVDLESIDSNDEEPFLGSLEPV